MMKISVSNKESPFAFNLSQICALIAGRGVYESGPLVCHEGA